MVENSDPSAAKQAVELLPVIAIGFSATGLMGYISTGSVTEGVQLGAVFLLMFPFATLYFLVPEYGKVVQE